MARCVPPSSQEHALDLLLLLCRLTLAGVFLLAGIAKLRDRSGSVRAIGDFGVPARLAAPLGTLLPVAEIAVALLLLPVPTAWFGSIAALVLLVAFMAGIAVTMARGRAPDCHCFGQIHSEPIGWSTLGRNAVLSALAAAVVVRGSAHPGASVVGWLSALSAFEVGTLIAAVAGYLLLAVQGWFIYNLLRAQGRILQRLDTVTAPPAPEPEIQAQGLAVGTPAPSFALSDLSGAVVDLHALRGHGRPVVLIFTDTNCGPCQALLPEIDAWQQSYRDRLTFAMISRGTAEENRAKVLEHHIDPVLLQQDREVANHYQAYATPSAVVVHPDGAVASAVAAGGDAIRTLLARTLDLPPTLQLLPHLPVGAVQPRAGNGHVHPPAPAVGDLAPEVGLPDLEGRTVDLADFRGDPTVVLFFWNPDCGFCRQLLPDLLAWETERAERGPRALVVSTGPAETNRAQGIRSPLVLDPQFAAGTSFGAEGTPAAVLVDAQGRIASSIVVGGPAVRRLLNTRSPALTAVHGGNN